MQSNNHQSELERQLIHSIEVSKDDIGWALPDYYIRVGSAMAATLSNNRQT
tara:strand:+ start:542 stop:694 length:153 start_codon:yes stop_codon:yes gene_type:complete